MSRAAERMDGVDGNVSLGKWRQGVMRAPASFAHR